MIQTFEGLSFVTTDGGKGVYTRISANTTKKSVELNRILGGLGHNALDFSRVADLRLSEVLG